MLNIFAKCLLVSTSLSPVLGTMAINQFERGKPMDDLDLVVGGGIYFGCSLLGTLEICR